MNGNRPSLLYLNACHSSASVGLEEAIDDSVVIAFDDRVSDLTAVKMAVIFYRKLDELLDSHVSWETATAAAFEAAKAAFPAEAFSFSKRGAGEGSGSIRAAAAHEHEEHEVDCTVLPARRATASPPRRRRRPPRRPSPRASWRWRPATNSPRSTGSRHGLSTKTAAAASEKAFAEGELALSAGDKLTALHWFAASPQHHCTRPDRRF